MIVDPDFLDHWRTGMVVDALGDPMAPVYILRLWAHCQERKSDTFAMPPRGLKAQCKFPGDADQFERALSEAGFVKRDGDSITVCGWAEKNASLLAAWENGSKGGRPKKNPDETHGKPMGNPAVTHGQPSANPDETDKSREEKSREEPTVARASRLPQDWVLPDSWRTWAKAQRPDLDPLKTAEQFRDYWAAKPGKDGRKLDWEATWRNWVRNQRQAAPVKQFTPLHAHGTLTVINTEAERTKERLQKLEQHAAEATPAPQHIRERLGAIKREIGAKA